MKCQQFESLIVSLTCGLPMDEAERSDALAHAAACALCGARAAQQQNVAAGLRALAAEERMIAAPARIGAALQAAFAQHVWHSRTDRAAASSTMADSRVARPWFKARMSWRLVGTVAALLLLSLCVTALWLRTREREAQPARAAIAQAQGEAQTNAPSNNDSSHVEPKTITPSVASASIKRRAPSRVKTARSEAQGYGALLSLTPIAWQETEEFQQVVRLQIPRATLRLWGLPVNEESTSEQVSAEVYFSEDGVARAIRLHR